MNQKFAFPHSSRPLIKKKKKQTRGFQLVKKWRGILLILGVTASGCMRIINSTLAHPDNIIASVSFAQESVATYDDPELFGEVSKILKGKNYYRVRFWAGTELFAPITQRFPQVKSIALTLKGPRQTVANISFHSPGLKISNGQQRFAAYNEHIFAISTGDLITTNALEIKLPEYLSGNKQFTGFFFKISQEKLMEQLNYLTANLPETESIVYFPGGSKTQIRIQGKTVYFNNLKSFEGQVKRYQILENEYADFTRIKEIDLGSLENVIIKK